MRWSPATTAFFFKRVDFIRSYGVSRNRNEYYLRQKNAAMDYKKKISKQIQFYYVW
jgi:hypothetical protein